MIKVQQKLRLVFVVDFIRHRPLHSWFGSARFPNSTLCHWLDVERWDFLFRPPLHSVLSISPMHIRSTLCFYFHFQFAAHTHTQQCNERAFDFPFLSVFVRRFWQDSLPLLATQMRTVKLMTLAPQHDVMLCVVHIQLYRYIQIDAIVGIYAHRDNNNGEEQMKKWNQCNRNVLVSTFTRIHSHTPTIQIDYVIELFLLLLLVFPIPMSLVASLAAHIVLNLE